MNFTISFWTVIFLRKLIVSTLQLSTIHFLMYMRKAHTWIVCPRIPDTFPPVISPGIGHRTASPPTINHPCLDIYLDSLIYLPFSKSDRSKCVWTVPRGITNSSLNDRNDSTINIQRLQRWTPLVTNKRSWKLQKHERSSLPWYLQYSPQNMRALYAFSLCCLMWGTTE